MSGACPFGHFIEKTVLNPYLPFGPVRRDGSHYCPKCLTARDGRWMLSWRLPWSFACTAHGTVLLDDCPACGRPPRPQPRLGRPRPRRHLPGPGGRGHQVRSQPGNRPRRAGGQRAARRAAVGKRAADVRRQRPRGSRHGTRRHPGRRGLAAAPRPRRGHHRTRRRGRAVPGCPARLAAGPAAGSGLGLPGLVPSGRSGSAACRGVVPRW